MSAYVSIRQMHLHAPLLLHTRLSLSLSLSLSHTHTLTHSHTLTHTQEVAGGDGDDWAGEGEEDFGIDVDDERVGGGGFGNEDGESVAGSEGGVSRSRSGDGADFSWA